MSNISAEAFNQFFIDIGPELAESTDTERNFKTVRTVENTFFF